MNALESTNGKKILLEEARKYVQHYQDLNWPFPFVKTDSMLIRRECIESILAQDGCSFIRLYMAKTESGDSGQYTLVILGADIDRKNIIKQGNEAQIYQELGICPPECFGTTL